MRTATISQMYVRSCLEALGTGGTGGTAAVARRLDRTQLSLPQLKQNMLLAELQKTADPLLSKAICGAANQAAALAWSAQKPLEVFPELFEACVEAVRNQNPTLQPWALELS